jgi:hypothetical protein
MPAGIPSLILRSWNEFDLKFERAPSRGKRAPAHGEAGLDVAGQGAQLVPALLEPAGEHSGGAGPDGYPEPKRDRRA